MNKNLIYINKIKEDWIIDRVRAEWYKYNPQQTTNIKSRANVYWLLSPWIWKSLNLSKISNKKKIICSIYHIDEIKADGAYYRDFLERDKFITKYHVISNKTENQIRGLTDKEITTIPFWINTNIFYYMENKIELRKKYNILQNKFVIGSFQRDSEGNDLTLPKLSKGPDRLLKIYEFYKSIYGNNLLILLSGKRRNYIIKELKLRNIDFYYLEMVDFKKLNELYNLLNLYIVASRFEGGPQAILESAITKTPIISTDVGIAAEILSDKSIFNMQNFRLAKPDVDSAYDKAKQFSIPEGFAKFNYLFESI